MFHTRAAAILMAVVALVYVLFFNRYVADFQAQTDFGIGLSSNIRWHIAAPYGSILNLGLNVLIMVLMILINRTFNVLRSMTWLMVGLFALMQAAVPYSLISLNSGSLVCCVLLLCLMLMYRNYSAPNDVYGVFLAFLLLSAGAVVQYCFVVFVPLMWIICLQMRIFSLRAFSASMLGLATVWMILIGFGLVDLDQIGFPPIVNIFSYMGETNAVYLLVVVGLTAFMLVASILMNVFKTMAYNAQARSYSGALIVTSAITIIAMAVNYNNILAYLPLLNCCAAFQITHYFVNHRYERQYLGILGVIAVYILLYVWRVII